MFIGKDSSPRSILTSPKIITTLLSQMSNIAAAGTIFDTTQATNKLHSRFVKGKPIENRNLIRHSKPGFPDLFLYI